ncbi:hypothetical protein [Ruegeria sp. HKCCD8929]|uniref:hypothetical protein n=1 Tax=Ruegeria sp. HKCCD8929 TaxID=2683006 RepID=UPI0014892A6C|nr:hypothetical protein [Ruegeria sp. HKCCD8929]
MGSSGPDIDELKNLIALSRQRDLSFGFCLGKKVETSVLVMHRDRAPDAMAREARQQGETPKIAFGTASTKGRVLTLTCANRPPPRLARKVKRYLHSHGLKLRVQLAEPATPHKEAQQPPPESEAPQKPPSWEALRKAVGRLADRKTRQNPEIGDKLTTALGIADRKSRDGETKAAAKALRQIVRAFGLSTKE